MKSLILILAVMLTANTYAQGLAQNSRGNKFNPAIGLNALTLFKNSARSTNDDGFSLQEIELQFSSEVDAYFRAEATVAFHEEESTTNSHAHEFKAEPEEVFVETISIPGLTIRAGKFLVNFGKYNTYHSHALPFIYQSKLHETMFGDEGLAEAGIGFSALAPFGWFSEVSAQIIQPTNDTLFVDSHHQPAYVFKWKNLWELGDSATIEWAASGLMFASHDHGSTIEDKTSLLGTDLTFKWRPTKGGKSSSFVWSNEFIHVDRAGTNTTKNAGITSFMRYQMAERWHVGAQYEYIGLGKNVGTKDTNAYSGLLVWTATEFSAIRAQYDSIHDGGTEPEKRISMQLNISIGAHPAHMY